MHLVWLTLVVNAVVCTSDRPDIATLENEQKLLIQNLNRNKDIEAELKENLDLLHKRDDNFSLDSSSIVVPPDQENIVKIKTGYTPPIIIMLPEDPTPREKWEYAVTLRCLGQKNFDVFTNVHNTRMAKMMAIKGKTVEEIQEEIKETEKGIKNVQSDLESAKKVDIGDKDSFKGKTKLLHKTHNIKLINRELEVLNVKLQRLQKRLKSAILFGRRNDKERDDQGEKNDDEAEKDDGEEDDKEGEDNEDEEEGEEE